MTNRKKFDRAAAVRSLMSVRDLFLKRAVEYAEKPETHDLVEMKREDAKDVRKLASAVGKKQFVKAFKQWRSMDSLPRDYVPRRTINWIAVQAVKEWEKTHGKKANRRSAKG